MSTKLELKLLGNIEIHRDGMPLGDLPTGKSLALLCYLAVTGRAHTRPALAGLLWGEMPEAKARGNLTKALGVLRRQFGRHFTITYQTIAFNLDSDYRLDIRAFEAMVSSNTIETLQEAIELYEGEFLEGFYIRQAAEFEHWVLAQRARLNDSAVQMLHTLATHFTGQGESGWMKARDYLNRLLQLEPWREEAHRQLMHLLAINGQRGAALSQYETCQRVLAEELGVEPGTETTALYHRIRQGVLSTGIAVDSSGYTSLPTSLSVPEIPDFLQIHDEPTNDDRLSFVAREDELARLDLHLEQTLEGQGQVIFVVGEAGSGKTELVREFIRRTLDRETNLIVAEGNCNAYEGIGDPYLPFREVLNQLTGDVEAKQHAGLISRDHALRLWQLIPQSAQVLIDVGSDLFDIFVSASDLAERLRQMTVNEGLLVTQLEALSAQDNMEKHQGNLDQTDLFEAFTRVLQTLAQEQPLILILDDLQWADIGSLSLLFHLGRRLTGRSILVVGIYRPNDVALGRDGERHPLEMVVNEFQKLFGNMPLDLGQVEGKLFVDGILDIERNRLNHIFREKLYQHTQGHALFTVEILRDLQARGDLRLDKTGVWIEGIAINWTKLPARIEGVIRERIERLPATQQDILKVASIMGEEFTAEVVAWVLQLDEREVVRQLSGPLDKQHYLVQSRGSQRVGVQRLAQYRFRHILFQYYLYDSIGEVERAYLHEDVGNQLEHLYQDQLAVVTVQLARHFKEAGLVPQAVAYLQQAGEQAIRGFANQEAIQLFKDAIILLKTLPEKPSLQQKELQLQLHLAEAQRKAGQIAEAMETFQLSVEIAEGLSMPEDLTRAALGYEELSWRYNLPAESAVHLLEKALNVLGEADSPLRIRVFVSLARATFMSTGSWKQRAALTQQAVEMARRTNEPLALYETLHNNVLVNRQPEKLKERLAVINEMLLLAKRLGDTERILDATMLRIYDQLAQGDIQAVDTDLKAYNQMAEETQQPFFIHNIGVMQTGLLLLSGRFDEAERLAQETFNTGQQKGVENADGVFGMQMFTIRREQGRLQELAPVIRHFVKHHAAASTWRPGLALIYSDLRLKQEARAEFEYLVVNDFAALPQDALWLTCVVYLSEVCAFLGDADRAAILYRHLLPYAGHSVVVGFAVACYGAVSRYLGLLAATMSRWEDAELHFKDALNLNANMDAKPWLAHTQYQYAAMLLTRDQAGDRERAKALLDQALTMGHDLGMQSLVEKACVLRQ